MPGAIANYSPMTKQEREKYIDSLKQCYVAGIYTVEQLEVRVEEVLRDKSVR
jgi:hypothetical protein